MRCNSLKLPYILSAGTVTPSPHLICLTDIPHSQLVTFSIRCRPYPRNPKRTCRKQLVLQSHNQILFLLSFWVKRRGLFYSAYMLSGPITKLNVTDFYLPTTNSTISQSEQNHKHSLTPLSPSPMTGFGLLFADI